MKPPRRGAYAHLVRDQRVVLGVQTLVDDGFRATRNRRLPMKVKRGQASAGGGSACDAVGVALGMNYKAVDEDLERQREVLISDRPRSPGAIDRPGDGGRLRRRARCRAGERRIQVVAVRHESASVDRRGPPRRGAGARGDVRRSTCPAGATSWRIGACEPAVQGRLPEEVELPRWPRPISRRSGSVHSEPTNQPAACSGSQLGCTTTIVVLDEFVRDYVHPMLPSDGPRRARLMGQARQLDP